MNYRAIKFKGKKIDFHRHIMEIHLGRKLSRKEVVHHKDGNKLNNDLSNLEVMTLSDHSRLHMKGIKLSQSTKDKLSLINIANKKNRRLTEDNVKEIRSFLNDKVPLRTICKKYNVSASTIHSIKLGETYFWVQ